MSNIVLDEEKKIISISENNFNEDNSKELKDFLHENFLMSIEFDIVQGSTILFFGDDETKEGCKIVINGEEFFINVFACDENKIKFSIHNYINGNANYIFEVVYYDDNGVNIYIVDYIDGYIDIKSSGLLSCETFPNILGAIKCSILEYKLAQ